MKEEIIEEEVPREEVLKDGTPVMVVGENLEITQPITTITETKEGLLRKKLFVERRINDGVEELKKIDELLELIK